MTTVGTGTSASGRSLRVAVTTTCSACSTLCAQTVTGNNAIHVKTSFRIESLKISINFANHEKTGLLYYSYGDGSIVAFFWEFYEKFNAAYPLAMSFVKFAVLATFGECIGLRITNGVWNRRGFGILPRAVVWGILGVCIALAMGVFSKGVPAVMGVPDALAGAISWKKALVALSVSVAMNTVFAPVFMTFHKITDMHIAATGGTLRGFFSHPLQMGESLAAMDWHRQWSFVFARTIPLFWYPAHTITFLLPPAWRVLFAALLGVALGILLAVASLKK